MNSRFTVVETSLNRAEFRWKWLRFLQRTFLLAMVVCLALALFAGAILGGGLTNKSLATTLLVLVLVGASLAWLVMLICLVAGNPDRNWLAAMVERVDRRLQDRLNTLLFLERRNERVAHAFSLRIARQTQRVLAGKDSPPAFSGGGTWIWFGCFLFALGTTWLIYRQYEPWQHLVAADKARKEAVANPDQPLELDLPAVNQTEQREDWGEVRIIDPGTDLTVTKGEVVPLQIEAASSRPLTQVGWFSALNGAEETPHPLAPPSEPRYAAYQPTIDLDELQLSDWDVMTYYARAQTGPEQSFASEVYFLEVRPFQEELAKLPGDCHGSLNELTALIKRQQHVLRQTHQHVQKPPATAQQRTQDRTKLAEAEKDLGNSTRHLYAKMAARLKTLPSSESFDELAKAEQSLDRAAQHLQGDLTDQAQQAERSALAELVAARKRFQKIISDHPDAFKPEPEETDLELPNKLKEMAEFRDETGAAEQFLQKTLEQQRKLEQQAATRPRAEQPAMARQEQALQQSLQDFQQQHPGVFKELQSQSEQTCQAMAQAAQALKSKSDQARAATQQATRQVEELNQAFKNQSQRSQLADAYKLDQMLQQQIHTFGQCANAPESVADPNLRQTAEDSRETLNQLKRLSEQEPTRDAFREPLRQALSGNNKVKLDTTLNQVKQAADSATKQQRAGEARDALQQVRQAFSDSKPSTLQMADENDLLKTPDAECLNAGVAGLENLLQRLEKNGRKPGENETKQARESLFNLQTGLRNDYGDNERALVLQTEIKELLKSEMPLNVDALKKLLAQLQHFSVETSEKLNPGEKPQLAHIDPSRLPPAYRGRIQKYFQKLSEK